MCPDRCPKGRPICVRGSCIGMAQVAMGGWYSCALLTDTTVWCWGGNDQGQLGDGTTTARSTPAPVAGLQYALDGRTLALVNLTVEPNSRDRDGRGEQRASI